MTLITRLDGAPPKMEGEKYLIFFFLTRQQVII